VSRSTRPSESGARRCGQASSARLRVRACACVCVRVRACAISGRTGGGERARGEREIARTFDAPHAVVVAPGDVLEAEKLLCVCVCVCATRTHAHAYTCSI